MTDPYRVKIFLQLDVNAENNKEAIEAQVRNFLGQRHKTNDKFNDPLVYDYTIDGFSPIEED
jgi:hypothetical protein